MEEVIKAHGKLNYKIIDKSNVIPPHGGSNIIYEPL